MSEVKRCENCGNEQIQILNYKGDYLCGICGRDTERLHEIEHDAEVRATAIEEITKRFKDWMLENYGLSEQDIQEIDEIAEEMRGAE